MAEINFIKLYFPVIRNFFFFFFKPDFYNSVFFAFIYNIIRPLSLGQLSLYTVYIRTSLCFRSPFLTEAYARFYFFFFSPSRFSSASLNPIYYLNGAPSYLQGKAVVGEKKGKKCDETKREHFFSGTVPWLLFFFIFLPPSRFPFFAVFSSFFRFLSLKQFFDGIDAGIIFASTRC